MNNCDLCSVGVRDFNNMVYISKSKERLLLKAIITSNEFLDSNDDVYICKLCYAGYVICVNQLVADRSNNQ